MRQINIKAYSSKVAYPTIILTMVAIAIYVCVAVLTYYGDLKIGWCIVINSLMAYLLFTPMHEAGHLNISGDNKSLRWMNEVIGWLSGIPLLAPYYIFKVIHFRHHAFTNDSEKDPDHWLASNNIVSLLFHSSTIFPIYLIKGIRLLFFEKKITKKVKRDLKIGFVGFFAINFLLLLAVNWIGWYHVLIIWLIPALIGQIVLAITFDWLPHHPHHEKSRYLNTRIFDLPGLSVFLLGQNYHLIHHLHPRIPFYNYQEVYTDIKEELVNEGTEIISLEKQKA